MPGHYISYQQAISGDRRSPQDRNIQPAQGPAGQPFSPQDRNIQPAQGPAGQPFSPQDMNIPPAGGGSGSDSSSDSGSGSSDTSTTTDDKDDKKEKKPKIDIISGIVDFYNAYKNFGGILGLGAIPFKMIAEPTVKTFQNPQALAVLKKLFDEKGKDFKDEYLQDYGELIDEAFKDFDSGITKGLDSSEILDLQLNQASDLSQQGILGKGSQRINFPEEFYAGKNMPATTGNLVNLANLDAQQYLSGENYNPELAQMIFNARAELDRMGKDRSGNTQSGIMAASPALPGISVPAGGTVSSPAVTPNPVLTPVPIGGITPTTTGITPFNINQFYASLPQYTQQGIMSPNLAQFNQNLRMFPGMA